MAAWKPAPARSIVPWLVKPAVRSCSSMNADTTLLIPMEATKATSGGTKPGVWRSWRAVTRKFSSETSPASSAAMRAAAEPVGGVGGRSRNWSTVPAKRTAAATEMMLKYVARPAVSVAMVPPTRKAVAMPTWLKLMAIAVACARSSAPNHVALSSGGVHWKKGCAAPTRTVPATTNEYGCSISLVGRPPRSAQPVAIAPAAALITLPSPKRFTIVGSSRQKSTFVKRKMSISVAGSRE